MLLDAFETLLKTNPTDGIDAFKDSKGNRVTGLSEMHIFFILYKSGLAKDQGQQQ